MEHFKCKVESDDSGKEYNFECEDNTFPIEMDDFYLFFFAGIADIGRCQSENEKYEINKNDRKHRTDVIDLTTGFWKKCYKIRKTDFDLNTYEL